MIETSTWPTPVSGDPVLLAHLVRNLVENATRYNGPGGRVGISVAPGVLQVTNTGPELPADVVPRLFEPFRRVNARRHAPREGAGLGLSIVASIARAHGGTATARANPGGGLTVRVSLPRPDSTKVEN